MALNNIAKSFSGMVFGFLKFSHKFNVVMRNCVYAMLFFDFLYLAMPLLVQLMIMVKVLFAKQIISPESIAVYQSAKEAIFSEKMLSAHSDILLNLHLYIFGTYAFNNSSRFAIQGLVAMACTRAGVDPTPALKIISASDSPDEGKPAETVPVSVPVNYPETAEAVNQPVGETNVHN